MLIILHSVQYPGYLNVWVSFFSRFHNVWSFILSRVSFYLSRVKTIDLHVRITFAILCRPLLTIELHYQSSYVLMVQESEVRLLTHLKSDFLLI